MRSCRAKYDLKHSLSCKKGGFVRFRHYLLRNITSNLIDQVFQDVPVEPPLQTLTDEIFDGYINECERRGQVGHQCDRILEKIQGFLTQTPRGVKAESQRNVAEQIKWRRNENITSVFKLKNGSSTPLNFSVNDGVGKEANKSCSRIAETWI